MATKTKKKPQQNNWHIWHGGDDIDEKLVPVKWRHSTPLDTYPKDYDIRLCDLEMGLRVHTDMSVSIYKRGKVYGYRVWYRHPIEGWIVMENRKFAELIALTKLGL